MPLMTTLLEAGRIIRKMYQWKTLGGNGGKIMV